MDNVGSGDGLHTLVSHPGAAPCQRLSLTDLDRDVAVQFLFEYGQSVAAPMTVHIEGNGTR